MRILMIRHGDPDYVNDTLTEKGWREAALLADTAKDLRLGDCYVSPLGRAADTASCSLKITGKTAKTMDWLQEFPVKVDINDCPELQKAYPDTPVKDGKYLSRIAWDMLPGYWAEHPEYMDSKKWRETLVCQHSNMIALYDEVTESFDLLLEKYGYGRNGMVYRVNKESEETITLFCHFGVACVLMSHLWNVSPFVLWHSFVLAPTSVTEIHTEEREQGIASFRAARIGDQSHLYRGGEQPSFAARFCETFGNTEQRH
ncbi:MAG: histidine phosphatase family protein [Oliverpabstia sp.]